MKIENTDVYNLYPAIIGIRNPYNSWDRSDSAKIEVEHHKDYTAYNSVILGDSDKKLSLSLVKAGNEHRKFLRQIMVSVDLTLPLFLWAEFDTYKVGTVRNSGSTMHTLTKRKFIQDDFEVMLNPLILDTLNISIDSYNNPNIKDDVKIAIFKVLKNMLPSGYIQMATVTMNYENLLNMYHQRKNHKLEQWHTICDWILKLPYMVEFCYTSNEG